MAIALLNQQWEKTCARSQARLSGVDGREPRRKRAWTEAAVAAAAEGTPDFGRPFHEED